MQFIGALYGGRSVTQVALNYLIAQGEEIIHSYCACRLSHIHVTCGIAFNLEARNRVSHRVKQRQG